METDQEECSTDGQEAEHSVARHYERLRHRSSAFDGDELSPTPSVLDDDDDDNSVAGIEPASARRGRILIPRGDSASAVAASRAPAPADRPVSVADAVGALRNLSNFNALKKKLARVDAAATAAARDNDNNARHARPKTQRDRKPSAGATEVPLPRAAAERVQREQAYAKVAADVGRWQPLVKRNREETGTRAFPANAAPRQVQTLTGEGQRQRVLMTGMEQEIDALLRQSGVAQERDASKAEELAMNHLTMEEVVARRRELAKMRSLLFFEEKKAKRIKKIKSKKFRKIQKKDKLRKIALLPGHDADPIEKALQRERERVEERMTLKHKNTSKWVKRKLQRQEAGYNENTRAAIEEQLRVGEKLRQKIATNDSDDDDHSDAGKTPGLLTKMQREVADQQTEILEGKTTKGLFGLKFMQRAVEKNKARQDAAKRDDFNDNDSENENNEAPVHGAGRLRFKGKPDSTTNQDTERQIMDASEQEEESDEEPEEKQDIVTGSTRGFQATTEDVVSVEDPKKRVRAKVSFIELPSKPALRNGDSNPWLRPVSNKLKDTTGTMLPTEIVALNPSKTAKQNVPQIGDGAAAAKRSESLALMQESFQGAGAELDDFQNMKDAEIDSALPSAEDLGLSEVPGWGSWSGAGIKRTRAQERKTSALKQEMASNRKAAVRARRDAGQAHLILSQKRIKRASALTVEKAPFPFVNKSQYEASLAAPLGRDWTTPSMYRNNVKPKIVVKTGTVIAPIRFGGDKGRAEAAARTALA